jgi:very-short-patch-repair endonuclease
VRFLSPSPLAGEGLGVRGLLIRHRDRARGLRRFPTGPEVFLWRQLRGRAFKGLKFRRQLALGNYIVDFVCLEKRFIIELDGGHHNTEAQRQYDLVRDQWLRSQGFRILRYWNNEILDDWEAVAEAIWKAAKDGPSPPAPLPQGERGDAKSEPRVSAQ